ncbi:MAG: glycosyltransferase family 39 protein, partial [Anaerolineales bacterium]|nr:glycosyltransferase family 39 protein [Anaerolineales bacterium]
MKRDTLIFLLLTAVALALRLWQLGNVPPGWRDDELINSLVISQKVLDGDWQLYYADASGHEALYHILNAAFLGLFGPGVAGIRWLSVIMGTLTVPFTYLLGKLLYSSRWVGIVAALGLAVSFWSLMYSRIGLRHVSLPFLMLPAFYFFLRPFFEGVSRQNTAAQREKPLFLTSWRLSERVHIDPSFVLAAVFLGLSFYTYFASRGVPLILLAWLVYVALVDGSRLKAQWRGLLVMGLLTAVFALPLALVLQQQPEAEARVAELAAPVINARAGDFSLLQEHIIRTLNMFHSDGDDEWLYNIPFRPVFGPVGAIFFWLGVLLSFGYALRPLVQRLIQRSWSVGLPPEQTQAALASAFLLLWWLAGIAPAFLSIPPGSLGHTIVAQSAVYLLTAVPLFFLTQRREGAKKQRGDGLPTAAGFSGEAVSSATPSVFSAV